MIPNIVFSFLFACSTAPHLHRLALYSTELSRWVAAEILHTSELKARVALLTRLLEVAHLQVRIR